LLGLYWLLRLRFGLVEEDLVAKEDSDKKAAYGKHGTQIAATAAASAGAALRLKIGILNFGQRIRPVGSKRGAIVSRLAGRFFLW
jgi:hypothetical protein